MTTRKTILSRALRLSVACLCLLTIGTRAWGDDLDIFNPAASVQPNVLFILDNSGSMNDSVTTIVYDPSQTYTCTTGCTYSANAVYQQDRKKNKFINSYTQICSDINANPLTCNPSTSKPTATGKTQLLTTGFWFPTSSLHEYLGNYLNFKKKYPVTTQPKITIAKSVLNDLIDAASGVRLGLMIFNQDEGGHIVFPVNTMDATSIASMHSAVNGIVAGTWTPLSETLYEAGLYYSGAASRFNTGVHYTSPIQASCQANHTIIITDGSPTQDLDLPSLIGDRDGDQREPGMVNDPHYPDNGSDYLDDVAMYWFNQDMRSDLPGVQNMRTYTVGFATSTDPLANPLLQRAAQEAGGTFFTANDTADLKESLRETLVEIAEVSNSFIAPVIPIDQANRTTNGDYLYLSLFAPSSQALWAGNLKKFALDSEGNIIDADGQLAVDSEGTIYDTARSFWTPTDIADGGDVRVGGTEGVLEARTSPRQIYTKIGSSNDLTDSSNAFTTANTNITLATLDVPDSTERDDLINYVRGQDSYDDDDDGDITENRVHVLGDFLHGRPSIVHYDSSTTVIYSPGNDGMIHAFDDSDGSEKWAFIPPDILPRLEELRGTSHPIFLDGSPNALVIDGNGDGEIHSAADGDRVILIFGRRRGGDAYTALDVTDPNSPQFMYQIDASTSGFSELGQSWSKPTIVKVKVGSTDMWVALVSGGYDTNEDNDPVTAADTKGRGVFAFNVETGAKVWGFSYNAADTVKATMAYAIPSDVTVIDSDSDGYADRLYVGDLGGQLWRMNGPFNSPDITTWTGKIIFNASAADTTRRKFFFQPDVVQTYDYDVVLIGTGDHEHPLSTSVVDRLYSIRDNDPSSTYIETDLVNVTDDLLQSGTSSQRAAVKNALASSHGYYIKMIEDDGSEVGEKILSPPITFSGNSFFTTFVPNGSTVACATGGISRLYAVNYLTGVATMNFYPNNDTGGTQVLARQDRNYQIGASIASSVVIALRGGKAHFYVGTGGGIGGGGAPAPPADIILLNWQQLN